MRHLNYGVRTDAYATVLGMRTYVLLFALMGCGRASFDPAPRCFGGGAIVDLCTESAFDDEYIVDTAISIDTSSQDECSLIIAQSASAPELCVKLADRMTIAATLTATGQRPLVLVGATSLHVVREDNTLEPNKSILGVIDVSSTRDGRVGSGAQDSGEGRVCPENGVIVVVTGEDQVAGGGAGGSFGGQGGNGGDGGAKGVPMNAGASAGTSMGYAGVIRGGCRGGKGGQHSNGATAGQGGRGGGAVYLVGGEIQIDGVINASGSGGDHGSSSTATQRGGSGGGGGGSGGMIIVDSSRLAIGSKAILMANGGGGGQTGFLGTPSRAPEHGHDPDTTTPDEPAPGGGGPVSSEGNGGSGAAGPSTLGNAGVSAKANDDGGGGGGGGAGIIKMFPQPVSTGTISPPVTVD